jgi:methionyl-tRNA formyltransferase
MSLPSPSWRIVFFGTPPFAVPSLQKLLLGPDQVLAVVTQPDRGKGRGQKLVHSPVKELGLRHGVSLLQPERVREESLQQEISRISPDLLVVVAYGQILPKSLLTAAKSGALNVHAALLPKYRGAAPIAWTILNGDRVTGVTTIMMDEGMDTGDILLQKEIPVEERETTETLHDRLSILGAELLQETIEKLKAGALRGVKQDDSAATFAPILKKEDGRIDWGKDAGAIDRRVRGFRPWPGAYTHWDGRLVKVYEGEAVSRETAGTPGTVLWTCPEYVEVATGKGSFLLKEVQLEGKKRLRVGEFLPGHPIPVGTVFH